MWNENLQNFLLKTLFVGLTLYGTWLFDKYAMKFINLWTKKKAEHEAIDQTVVSFAKIIFKVLLWLLVALFVLQNLGLQITALLGGLGIAGLAIAFAFQKILEDVFSFFLIYFDKPFRVGDYIMVGADAGTVKSIGMRMTSLTTPGGQELLISNRELTNSRIQNFKKMKKRRVIFNFGLSYDTSVAKLETSKLIVRETFASLAAEKVQLDRVHLKELAASALVFEVAYDVLSREYVEFMDLQEKINLNLLKAFAKEKISLAYPTQTIKLQKSV
jgi:small-conductance mechanosensitive channel